MFDDPSSWLSGLAVGAIVAAAVGAYGMRRFARRTEAARRRARTAERLAELGAMTSGLAHEIKNPLSTIGLNAQLLAEGIDELQADADAKGRLSRRIGSLRREIERLRGILGDFLEYAGELRLDAKPADLNVLVDELVDFFSPQADQLGVRLRADLQPGPLNAPLDVARVKQAVLNLMLNAVQAMASSPPGVERELILRTRRETDSDGAPLAVLHVIDTGAGIESQNLPMIFRPYFSTKAGGTGLGLPTTRRIIEAHQGRIEAHSEPGRGTDFTVRFPALA